MQAMKRDNEFWDAVEANGALPAAAATLGWELINAGEGTVEVAFTADDRFLNPAGVIQGGFLAAMLDDTLGPALVSTLERGQFAPTADLHVQFLRPARPGRLTGRGRIVRRGKSVAFLSGELSDSDGHVVAVATATAVVQDGVIGKPQLHGRQAKVGIGGKDRPPGLARRVDRGRPGRPGTRSYSTPRSEPSRPGAALADLNCATPTTRVPCSRRQLARRW
jgi:uncharacterized protein (TIGR00369 family)